LYIEAFKTYRLIDRQTLTDTTEIITTAALRVVIKHQTADYKIINTITTIK